MKGDLLCPNCGSLARNRRLWLLLESRFLAPALHVLDFSPSRCLYRNLKKKQGISYQSTDLSGDFISDYQYDITNIKTVDNQFDLIICYHILEHVPNDLQAMKELHRVLKPGGTCLIQTPFKGTENIYEDPAIVSEQERTLHFGQKDHVRIYSVQGLNKRLTQVGFTVNVQTFGPAIPNTNGFKEMETILFCHKK
ncbi:MAG: class I SAM-dependent methyltransferase [Bacteroidales bacterium]|nr:class I SAM-dependent methyltransferase [Bacteroidales bacterium]